MESIRSSCLTPVGSSRLDLRKTTLAEDSLAFLTTCPECENSGVPGTVASGNGCPRLIFFEAPVYVPVSPARGLRASPQTMDKRHLWVSTPRPLFPKPWTPCPKGLRQPDRLPLQWAEANGNSCVSVRRSASVRRPMQCYCLSGESEPIKWKLANDATRRGQVVASILGDDGDAGGRALALLPSRRKSRQAHPWTFFRNPRDREKAL